MLATDVGQPFHREGWVYEEKYDGWRMFVERTYSRVTLTSRNGLEHSQRFPGLVKAIADLGAESLVLDGEVAVFDRNLVSRFEWLRAQPKDDVATPPIFMAFDLLELDGIDLRPRPLRERRQALEHLLRGQQLILPARRLHANGLVAWQQALNANYEGMVGKDPESPYKPGRTLSWLKLKQREYRKVERGFYR